MFWYWIGWWGTSATIHLVDRNCPFGWWFWNSLKIPASWVLQIYGVERFEGADCSCVLGIMIWVLKMLDGFVNAWVQLLTHFDHTRVTLYLFYRITLKNKFTKYCQGHTAWIRDMWRHRFSRSRVVCRAVRFKTFASRDEYIFDLGKNIFVLRNKYSFLCMSGDTIRGGISPQLWKVRGQGGGTTWRELKALHIELQLQLSL